ncbi:MAG: hypothetical protein LBP83_00880 [Dysgonamonadaceae bacterium]|jgi:hypothetical protein|nr:hypothetical protein [Dysgonamonadaceae bacterium]
MKKWFSYTLIFFLAYAFESKAQIVIGDQKEPENFSALELISKNGTGGIIHPQMTEAQRDAITASLSSSQKTEARGLVIYNTTEGCLNLYRNESEGWVSLCSGVIIPLLAEDVAEIRPMQGTIPGDGKKGKAKYDVAQSNSSLDGSCGVIGSPSRPGDFGNFNDNTDLRKYYEIVFPAGTYSYLVVGEREYATQFLTVTGGQEGSFSGGAYPIIVDFDPKIKELARGLEENNALYTTIFAVYQKDGQWYKAEYKLSVMDCLGCGVRIQTGEKEWMRVACYNLGITNTLADALSYSEDLIGDRYQWGRQTDGHEKTGAYIYRPKVALGEIVYPAAPLDSLDANGQPIGERRGAFIPGTGAFSGIGGDWSVLHHPALWGDGTQNAHPAKTVNDPCPKGFRIPSKTEMEKILNALNINTSLWGGLAKDDGILFLPYVYNKEISGTWNSGSQCSYWTATPGATPSVSKIDFLTKAQALIIQSDGTPSMGAVEKAKGATVRCIAE